MFLSIHVCNADIWSLFIKISIKIGRMEELMSWNMMVFCFDTQSNMVFMLASSSDVRLVAANAAFRELGGNPAGYWKLPSGAWSHGWWTAYEKKLTKFVLIAFVLWALKTVNTADSSGLQTTSLCRTPKWTAKGIQFCGSQTFWKWMDQIDQIRHCETIIWQHFVVLKERNLHYLQGYLMRNRSLTTQQEIMALMFLFFILNSEAFRAF